MSGHNDDGASPFQGELVRPLLSCTTPLPLKVGAYPGIGSGTAKNALHISQRSRSAVRFIEIIIIRLTVAKQEGKCLTRSTAAVKGPRLGADLQAKQTLLLLCSELPFMLIWLIIAVTGTAVFMPFQVQLLMQPVQHSWL